MQVRNINWLGLSALGAAICLATAGLRAEPQSQGPVYQVQDCCSLCPAAHDASLYTSNYMKNFITLIDAQDGWLFRTQEDLRTEFGTTPAGYRMLKELRDALKSKGVELVVVYQPTRGLVNRDKLKPADQARFDFDRALHNYRQSLARFEQVGLWVPDLSPLADEREEQPFYFRRDQHWTPYGAERTARLVAETVKRIPGFADIPQKAFVSKRIGLMGKTGTMQNVASKLCGTSYATQYIDQFITEPKEESGSDDLFGDSANPQIALVGTSHSGKNYNFSGFLEQHIGAEVLNVAFAGGGLEGSMLEYLGSEEFQNNPPKILIWEFSPLYDLASEKIHRQMMATLGNGCSGKPALLASKATLRPGPNEVLVNGKQQLVTLPNNRHQIDIRFSDPSVKTLEATLWYLSGRREKIKLEKPNTADTDGRFAFEMRDDQDWGELNFFALEIMGPEGVSEPVEVETRICARNDFSSPAKLAAQTGTGS
jgi:alginate biosynthesis protein AlgX